MKSTITLFYKSLVNKEKNFVLDDGNGNSRLEPYLSTLQKSVINDFQYIKIQLSLSIKIDMNQTNLEMIDSKDLNYVKIQNGTERAYYYFVVSKTWRSKETIELVLAMDTLNSFKFNSDYVLNEKTFVKRMHKDRFEHIAPESRDDFLTRKIDLKSEEISVPTYKKSEETLVQGDFNNTWVLYYKNRTSADNSPIDCYLASDAELTFLTETGSNTITASDIPNGKMLFLSPQMSGDITISVDGVNYRCYEQPNFSGNVSGQFCIVIVNNNGVLTFNRYVYTRVSTNYIRNNNYTITITNPTTIQVESTIETLSGREDTPPASSSYSMADPYWATNPFNPSAVNKTLNLAPLTERTIYSSNTIDKTLSENIKVINLPYCPSMLTENAGKYIIEELWKYDSTYHFFKLDDFNRKFKNTIVSNANDFYDKFLIFIPDYAMLSGDMKRTFKDSKLFHSDYYRPKFVYDSFTKIFPMEQIDFEYDEYVWGRKFKFDFVMTRNIVSKFLFKFDYKYKVASEDYPNIIAVARNNEEVLYNSTYLNYIRTGYNYDLKAKERQEIAGGIGIGLNVAGLIASIGLSFVPGMQGIGLGGAIGAGLGLIGQSINYAKTTAQNEENIQRKLQETQMQSVSVLNADDYDLLYEYTQNKAKLCLYEASERMLAILDDIFYYGGYIVNEQMIPNISSRYWFNFVQASLIINDSSNLTNEIEDDIKEKFEQGVTFLHYKKNKFDFSQEMENIEVFLYRNV